MKRRIVKNEKQFSEWFRKNYKKLGFSKIIRGDISRCPDFIMLREGREVRVELETLSSNFLVHKHPLTSVDEIICLVKDISLPKKTTIVKDLKFVGNIKATLSINNDVYEKFQRFCNKNAIMLSKKIELFMKEFLLKQKKEGLR